MPAWTSRPAPGISSAVDPCPNPARMPHSSEIEQRVNHLFLQRPAGVREHLEVRKMFGGLAYLYGGKMTVGIIGESLIARIPAASMDEALQRRGARPMDFTGRVMKEFVFVDPEGFHTDEELSHWIDWGLAHASQAMAPKKPWKSR